MREYLGFVSDGVIWLIPQERREVRAAETATREAAAHVGAGSTTVAA